MMEMARGYQTMNGIDTKDLYVDTLLIVKLPDSRVLRVVSRSLFLAMVILTLPSIGSFITGSSTALYDSDVDSDLLGFELLPIIFQDLANEGLIKRGQKGLIVSSVNDNSVDDLEFLNDNDNDIDLVIESDLDHPGLIPKEAFDFVFSSSFEDTKFIDRVLKIGGIVVIQLSNDPTKALQRPSNYKIVYVQRFQSTLVAMRKTGLANSPTKRRLLTVAPGAKNAALENLEDVFLEPPRGALAKSVNHVRKFKFLPDLLGDSLESYKRRIFITDEKRRVVDWFHANYPTRNQFFEVYSLDVELCERERPGEGLFSEVLPFGVGLSDWLMKINVRQEDYVVMKAEAQVVEEMIEENTIGLVDELFLECNNSWQVGGKVKKSKRAYWQCLALYGKLKDEGVAVHQWWG